MVTDITLVVITFLMFTASLINLSMGMPRSKAATYEHFRKIFEEAQHHELEIETEKPMIRKNLKFVSEFSPKVTKVEQTKPFISVGDDAKVWPCTTMRQMALQIQGKASRQADYLYCKDEDGTIKRYKLPLAETL